MANLSSPNLIALFLGLGILLLAARFMGEIARRLSLPSVLGEILAGILLGPTIFAAVAPELSAFLFPDTGSGAVAFEALTTLAITLFLLVAGIEVDLSTVWRQGKVAICVAVPGMLFPFAFGFAAAILAPDFLGFPPSGDRLVLALVMATVLSISALPIIAKILLDLKIYRSDLGVMLIAAAAVTDLLGWLVFAAILGTTGAGHGALPVAHTLWITGVYTVAMLTVVPWIIHRLLPWIQAYTSWPAGVLTFVLSMAFFSAAFTEWLGIHAIFGAFLAGVAIGHSAHLREQTRTTLDQFISFIFAPLFFAGIGLHINFAAHFDLPLTAILLGLALSGKVLGSALGGRWGGLPWREAWGAGFGMSAQGTMGIILGVLALQVGLIGQNVFVSLVVMALVTTMLSGPMLQRILRLKRPRRFTDHLAPHGFIGHLQAVTREDTITEMCRALAEKSNLDSEEVIAAVLARERIMATGLGGGIAVPHSRMENLPAPLIEVGLSPAGIDFDAPDGHPVHIIFLILTPVRDNGAQLEILADIGATFRNENVRAQAMQISGQTEFLALVNSER